MKKRLGFTLLELLIVIGIVGLMLGLVTPHLLKAKHVAQSANCQNGLKQWGIATLAYKNDHRGYLPREGASGQNHLTTAWYNALPPYAGAAPYNEIYDGKALEDKTHGGYRNNWIWYCPKKVGEQKNSGSGKNSCSSALVSAAS